MKDEAARSRRVLSLRTLLLLLVFATTVPALIVALVLGRRVVTDNRETIERQLVEAARSEARIVDAQLDDTIRVLQGVAQSDELARRQFGIFHAEAARLLATQPVWSSISLATPDGRELLNTSRPFGESLSSA